MSWEGKVYVTASNPYPGQPRIIEGSYPDASGNFPTALDDGLGINVYIAGGLGPSGSLPVSQTNPVQISLSGVSISGILEVTTSVGNPLEITGSVYVINQPSGSSGGVVTISGTASVNVENWPATQEISGTVSISSSQDNPVWITGAALDVNIKNSTIYVTSSITGTVAVSQTNPVSGVDILNWPVTQSVFVVNQTSGTVEISGVVDVTGTVSVNNLPAPVTEVTATISGATFTDGALRVTGTIDIAPDFSGTMSVTGVVSVDNFPAPVTEVTATISGVVDVSVSGTASVNVQNWPVSQSITGTVAIEQPVVIAVSGALPVSTGIVQVTSTQDDPLWVLGQSSVDNWPTGSTPGVFTVTLSGTSSVSVQNWPSPVTDVTATISGVVGVTGTVDIGNLPTTQSVTGTVSVEQPVEVYGSGVFSVAVSGTASVSVGNWPAPVTEVTAAFTGVIDVTGTVSVDNFPAVQDITGTVMVDQTGAFVVTSSQTSPVWITGVIDIAPDFSGVMSVSGTGVFLTTGTVHIDNSSLNVVVTNKVDVIPAAPSPTAYIPVRLTDGTNYYNSTGGGGSGSGGGNTVIVPPVNNPSTASLAVLAQTSSIITLIGGNSSRTGYQIFNDSAANLYLYLGTNNIANSQSMKLGPGQVYESQELVFVGNIYGSWDSNGPGYARVTEYSNVYGVTGSITVQQGSGTADTTLYPWMVKFPDYNMSAFGALRVAPEYTLLDLSNKYSVDSFEVDVTQSVSGNVSHAPLRAAIRLQTPTTSGSFARIRTNTYFKYQTGRGQRFIITAVHDAPVNNQERRWGYFDDDDGLFWRVSGSEFGFVRRTSTGGSPVDNFISQSAFNHDKMDGTGPSQQNIDLTKGNIYEVDFQWLGVGKVDLYINGYPCHVIQNANTYGTVYMKTANLPLSAGVMNNGVTAVSGAGFDFICANVTSEGGSPPAFHGYSIGRTTLRTAITTARVPVMSIRLSNLFPSGSGVDNRTLVVPTYLDIFAQPNANNQNPRIDWQLVLNPTTITGAAWTAVDVSGSAVEWDQSATAYTGGTIVTSGRFITNLQGASGLGGNTFQVDLSKFFDYQGRKLRRSAFAGVSDVLMLTAASTTAQNLDCDATISWEEYR